MENNLINIKNLNSEELTKIANMKIPQDILNKSINLKDFSPIKNYIVPNYNFKDFKNPMLEKLNDMTEELKIQTLELANIKDENIKLNSQLSQANFTIEKQLTELNSIKSNNKSLVLENKLLNDKLEDIKKSSRWSTLKAGIIGGIITLIVSILFNYIQPLL